MKLYGSITSPYARRLRLFLDGHDYKFINLDIFSASDRALLTKENPAQKIPFLDDHGIHIYDSGVIFRYLTQKLKLKELTWQQENILTLINAVNDSMISMLILQRSNINIEQGTLFFDLQRERTKTVLTQLDKLAGEQHFQEWDYLSISLFCLLDWLDLRALYDWSQYKNLVTFFDSKKSKNSVCETNPRNC